MADADTKGGKECVEGYDPKEKKLLEKVTAPGRLQELKRDQAQQDIKVKKELEHEQKLLMDLQNKLSDCNREYGDTTRQLEKLRLEQDVKLTPSQRQDITRTTRNLVGSFLQQRQRDAEERDVDVDVRYLPSMEEHKVGLRLGGEGGGSKDAKFSVRLGDNIKSLMNRAAMYWGLDADKVFVLDRDGRVIFEDVRLRDVILPPKQQRSGSSSSSAAPAAAEGNPRGDPGEALASYRGAHELEPTGGEEMYTVKGRNYQLTLVRALRPGEVLPRGQVNKHSAQGWLDFTFDERRLNADLQETARKFGDPDFQDTHVEMEDIPQLYDLIEEGKERKRLKRKDMACRVAEFIVFIVCFALHCSAVLVDTAWSTQMYYVSQTVEHSLTEFDNEERRVLGVSSFFQVATERQYRAWVRGPLQRSVLPPATEDLLARRLQTGDAGGAGAGGEDLLARRLQTGDPGGAGAGGAGGAPGQQGSAGANGTAGGVGAAGAPGGSGGSVVGEQDPAILKDPTRVGLNSKNLFALALVGVRYLGGSAQTNLEANWCPAETVRGGDDGTETNSTNESTTTPGAPPPGACAPESLRSCLNSRVVDIFSRALGEGHQVPTCKLEIYMNPIIALIESWQPENDFTYFRGEAATYVGGERNVIELTNESTFDSTVGDMEVADDTVPARLFLIFVFTPSLNGLFVFKMLFENTQSGGLVTSRQLSVIRLASGRPFIFVAAALAIVFALVCFFLEIRRIMACPKRCTFERERTPCSCWTFVFLLTPIVMLLVLAIFWARSDQVSNNEIVQFDPDTGSLTELSVLSLFTLTALDYYYNLVNMLVLLALNVLFLRYMLMFFPALSFTATMVQKVVRPLMMTFLNSALALCLLASCLYMIYAAKVAKYRNLVVSLIQAIFFAQGGQRDWYVLWEESPALFTVVLFVSFIVIHLVLGKMAAAVMLSYKKEKDLRQNYSYHRFWTTEVSKKGKTKAEFNPARICEPPKQPERGRRS